MKVRDLTISNSINLGLQREYNILKISNIVNYLNETCNNLEFYKPKYQILAELENRILFENNPDKGILIEYKPDGYVIFRLIKIKEQDDLRIVYYEYAGIISQ